MKISVQLHTPNIKVRIIKHFYAVKNYYSQGAENSIL